jgi:hypothetical protein
MAVTLLFVHWYGNKSWTSSSLQLLMPAPSPSPLSMVLLEPIEAVAPAASESLTSRSTAIIVCSAARLFVPTFALRRDAVSHSAPRAVRAPTAM